MIILTLTTTSIRIYQHSLHDLSKFSSLIADIPEDCKLLILYILYCGGLFPGSPSLAWWPVEQQSNPIILFEVASWRQSSYFYCHPSFFFCIEYFAHKSLLAFVRVQELAIAIIPTLSTGNGLISGPRNYHSKIICRCIVELGNISRYQVVEVKRCQRDVKELNVAKNSGRIIT